MDNRMKNRVRRVIRVLMVAVAIVLLAVAVLLPVVNNAIAWGVERKLKAIPLPENTRLVESYSVAEKMSGNGNGMQYYGVVLLESDCSLAELQMHYSGYTEGRTNFGIVLPQEGQQMPGMDKTRTFNTAIEPNGQYFAVYGYGNSPEGLQPWLDLDLRGH